MGHCSSIATGLALYSDKKIVCISSTSNIIPNPKALGYFSSKILLKKNFNLLNHNKTNIAGLSCYLPKDTEVKIPN